MTTAKKIQALEKEYNNLVQTIKGYLADAKTFGFEPTEYPQMQKKAAAIMQQLNKL
jgi:uncharacterized protein (UPF0335 family)